MENKRRCFSLANVTRHSSSCKLCFSKAGIAASRPGKPGLVGMPASNAQLEIYDVILIGRFFVNILTEHEKVGRLFRGANPFFI